MSVCVCVCVCLLELFGYRQWQGMEIGKYDTQRIGDGGEGGWITKKNQFLPYVCDLFGYIDCFTHWKESKGRVKPLNWKIKIQNTRRSQYEVFVQTK